MRKFIVSVIEILEVALVAVGSVFLIRNFLAQPFLVSGQSMTPTFYDGDYLLIDELTYRVREPERGEVVVFRNPQDEYVFFIKRIIGLPGDRLEINGNRVMVYNKDFTEGKILDEFYLPREVITSGAKSIALGDHEYYVLGDNRSYSYDSRTWGPLDRKEIIGLVRLRLWPLKNFRAFAAPQY